MMVLSGEDDDDDDGVDELCFNINHDVVGNGTRMVRQPDTITTTTTTTIINGG